MQKHHIQAANQAYIFNSLFAFVNRDVEVGKEMERKSQSSEGDWRTLRQLTKSIQGTEVLM